MIRSGDKIDKEDTAKIMKVAALAEIAVGIAMACQWRVVGECGARAGLAVLTGMCGIALCAANDGPLNDMIICHMIIWILLEQINSQRYGWAETSSGSMREAAKEAEVSGR